MPISCKYQNQIIGNELTHIRTVSRNINGYHNWVTNQVFEQIKLKQRYPVPNSNASDETKQPNNQTIVEKYGDKKHLFMMPYQGEKGQQIIKSVRKTVKRLLPRNIKLKVYFTGNKLGSAFNVKGKTKFEHKHDVIYLGTCPEMCNDNYIGEVKQRISERVKDCNRRGIKSHLLKHALENNLQHVSEKL